MINILKKIGNALIFLGILGVLVVIAGAFVKRSDDYNKKLKEESIHSAMFDCESKQPFSTDLNLQQYEIRKCKTKKGNVEYLLLTTPNGDGSLMEFHE